MAENCYDKDLLQYGGTAQAQRLLRALLPAYARVDERTTAGLILFAAGYSRYLNYFDFTNHEAGTWEEFMTKDVAVTVATVAGFRTKEYLPFLNHVLGEISEAATDAEAKQWLKVLFDFVFTLASQLDQNLRKLPPDLRFATLLTVTIASNLALPLNTLQQYYNDIRPALIDETSAFIDPQMPLNEVVFSQDFVLSALTASWQLAAPVAPPVITLSGSVPGQVHRLATHNLFTGPLQAFVNGVIQLVSHVPDYLEEMLTNYPAHAPHDALYLSFLRLFRFAQEHLNRFTENHLQFYYHDVLRLTNRPAEPGFVHLLFELQKNNTAHLLLKGTLFKAGKDAENHDLFYALTDNLVVQKGRVEALRSLCLQKMAPQGLSASPDAASEDGQGAKLLSADKSWFAFGDPKKVLPATVGFALQSNLLFLNEGARSITLLFQCQLLAGLATADLANAFTVQLSGEKGWYTAETISVTVRANFLLLQVALNGDAPAIVPYAQNLHGGRFPAELPLLQVTLKKPSLYQALKTVRVQSVTLRVSATVQNLSLQNEEGKIDPAKPFKPFGEFPESDAALIIGSREVFQKPLTNLTVNVDWQKAPAAGTTGDAVALKEGRWSSAAFDTAVNVGSATWPLQSPENIAQSDTAFSANEEYSLASVDGFIRLRYKSDANSISSYLADVKAAVSQTSVALQKDSDGNVTGFTLNAPGIQLPPSPPVARSISLSYSAGTTISFNETAANFSSRKALFYHLEPFGFREMHPLLSSDAQSLLPVFELDSGKPTDNGGELWIGLKEALPEQTYSLLFEVSDGTANPLKEMTAVRWYYLSNNNWLPFAQLAVADQTNNLTRSGLVVITLPAAATLNNTRADSDKHWIKAVVDHDTDAVCKLISVRANAAKAVFVQDLQKGIAYTQPLPPNTIAKMATPDAAIKKTEQPFASFGGRGKETDSQFTVRVSERLRHKQRAITAWDYERLVLQAFPQIHKAKCIPHTGFLLNENTGKQHYSETLPGHVMVVTIPDLQAQTAANKLRPYTSVGLLTEIRQYLQKRTSPFVRLHVTNPQFEEVQFAFNVSFYEGYDLVFYSNLLNTAIEQFLTPWAYNAEKSIPFGGRIEKSVVLNFVEEQPYVDFVTCFKMHHIIKREGSVVQEALYNVEEAIASTACSVLVSYRNEETGQGHLIQSPANCNCHD